MQPNPDQPNLASTPGPLMRDRSFITLLLVGGLNSTGRWLEMLVIAIFVLDATGSPLWVASMLMLRLLPLAIFGVFGGAIAARFQRFNILKVASVGVFCFAVVLFFLAVNSELQVWHVGLASFLSGMVWSSDFPVRRTLMSDIAGPGRVSRAMSLDILAGAATRTLGPLVGGILYQEIGLAGAFLSAGILYLSGLGALLLLRSPVSDQASTPQSVMATISAGFQSLRETPVMPGILAITVVFNLWGFPFISLVPVFGKEVLNLSDAATGFLVSAEGLGAFIGAVLLALLVQTRHARFLYVGAVFSYCLCALAFATSTTLWLSALCLLLVGLVSAAFGSMQSALVLMNAPPGQQSQMMGVLSVCIGTAPLGFLHIGLLADWLGTPLAASIVAAEGALALLLAVWRWPGVLSVQPTISNDQPSPK